MKILLFLFSFLLVNLGFSQILIHKQYTNGTNTGVQYMRGTSTGYVIGGSRLLTLDKKGNVGFELERKSISVAESVNKNGLVLSEHTGSSKIRAYVANYNNGGKLSWEKFYASGYWGNFVFDIVQNNQTGYIYGGRYASVTSSGATLVGIDPLGKQQWQVKWNVDPKHLTFTKKIEISNADPKELYVIGTGNGDSKGLGNGRDYFITKHQVDSGKRLWTYFPNSNKTVDATDIIELASDSILVIGNSSTTSATSYRGFLTSVSKNKTNWTKEYSSALPEKFYAIEKSPAGGFYILGNRFSTSSDSITTFLREINDTGLVIDEFILLSSGEKHVGIGLVRNSDSVYTVGGRYDNSITGKGYFLTQFNIANPTDTSGLTSSNALASTKAQPKVFPNPTSGLITIDGLGENNKVRIVNYLGAEIDSFTHEGNEKVSLSIEAKSGIYFVLISSGTNATSRSVHRIVKL